MEQMAGKQSIQFARAPHILSGASMVGKKEGKVLWGLILIKLVRKMDFLA